jgi:hypothetical protein
VNTPSEVLEPEQEAAEASNVAQTPDAMPAQAIAEEDSNEQLLVYCVKCKMKTVMLDPQPFTMKNGRAAIKGTCSICGSGQFRIGQL